MSEFDAAANAQIDSGAFAPCDLVFIDFVDDPLRVNLSVRDLNFAATGDPDLDGHTFVGFNASLVQIGDVADSVDGSDTLQIILSGVKDIDDALLAEIADKSKWQGRLVRIWTQIYDAPGDAQRGATISQYTGYASKIIVHPGPAASTIEMRVEKWSASSSQASMRTWLAQTLYDPNDRSAEATLAAANMGRGSGSSGGGAASGGGGGKGSAGNFLLSRQVSV